MCLLNFQPVILRWSIMDVSVHAYWRTPHGCHARKENGARFTAQRGFGSQPIELVVLKWGVHGNGGSRQGLAYMVGSRVCCRRLPVGHSREDALA